MSRALASGTSCGARLRLWVFTAGSGTGLMGPSRPWLEARKEELDRLQDRIQEGPRWSRVLSVSVIDESAEDVAPGFENPKRRGVNG